MDGKKLKKILKNVLDDFDGSLVENEVCDGNVKINASIAPYCSRMIYFWLHDPGKYSRHLQKISGLLALGKLIHADLQERFTRKGILVSMEEKGIVEINGGYISGKHDGLIEIDGERALIEIKTTNPWGFGKTHSIKEHHAKQLNLYLGMFGVELGNVIYVNTANYGFKVFEYPFNRLEFDKLIGKLENVIECYWKNELPPKDGEEWECKYCAYLNDCPVAGPGLEEIEVEVVKFEDQKNID